MERFEACTDIKSINSRGRYVFYAGFRYEVIRLTYNVKHFLEEFLE